MPLIGPDWLTEMRRTTFPVELSTAQTRPALRSAAHTWRPFGVAATAYDGPGNRVRCTTASVLSDTVTSSLCASVPWGAAGRESVVNSRGPTGVEAEVDPTAPYPTGMVPATCSRLVSTTVRTLR